MANFKPAFGVCAMFAGKVRTVNMRWGQLFLDSSVTQTCVSQHKAHIKELVNYLFLEVAQVHILYMNLELTLNAMMGMKRIIVFIIHLG